MALQVKPNGDCVTTMRLEKTFKMSSGGSLRIMRFEEGLGFVQLSFGYN